MSLIFPEDESSLEVEDPEEANFYGHVHAEDDHITSGYSTISSGKEEAYLTKHLQNAAAAKAA